MLYRTHILLGILFFLLFHNYFGANTFIVFFLVVLGSILPDIDERKSKMNQWSGIIGHIIAYFTKHRGIFHSMLFHLLIFVVLQHFINIHYARALFLGYLAHLVGDGITRRGVQIFYPFSKYKVKGPIRVGGFIEWIIYTLLIVLIIVELAAIIG